MKKRELAVLLFAIFAGEVAFAETPAPFEARQPEFQTYTFEKGIPPEFTADAKSKISLDKEHYAPASLNRMASYANVSTKRPEGEAPASIRWEWQAPGAVFTYRNSEAFRHLTGENPPSCVYGWVTFCPLSTFTLWVYNEE
ncbi:MAG: hypothetical protein WCP55_16070, partial [Lentisphaerota bacterium]